MFGWGWRRGQRSKTRSMMAASPLRLYSAHQRLVDGQPGPLGAGQAQGCLPPVGLVLEQVQVVGLVVVHADDPGHGVIVQVIEAARAGCSSSSWRRVTVMPSRMWPVNQPRELMGYQFCSRSDRLVTRRA